MKKSMLLTLSAAAIAACTFFEPNPILPIGGDYSIIDGDTVKTRVEKDFKDIYKNNASNKSFIAVGDTTMTYKAPKLHTPPGKDPDLTKIKNNEDADLKGKPVTMLVIGGSLSAGVRDGGYFNEGMLTSYPNLVARQMKLKKFELPLFDAAEYNGTGRMAKTSFNPTGGPVQKYKAITNNLSLTIDTETKKNSVKTYKGDPDNLVLPYATRASLMWGGNYSSDISKALMLRVNPSMEKDNGFKNKIKNKKTDFFILESGLEEALIIALKTYTSTTGTGVRDYTFKEDLTYEDQYIYSPPELQIVRDLLPKNAKGVLLNIPNVLDLPVFISKNEILNNSVLNYVGSPLSDLIPYINRLFPSSKVDSMLSPKVNIMLKPGLNKINPLGKYDFLGNGDDEWILRFTNQYNNMLQSFNKKWGFPIVDINGLYSKVLSKEGFRNENGVLLTAENFFSDDKINPSALGQAVIANEVIKAINTTYKTDIPLINVKEYSTK